MPDQNIANTEEQSSLEAIGSTLAEALSKQHNPLETTSNQTFVSEPFFKEEAEEDKKDEAKTDGEEAKIETPELNEDGSPKIPATGEGQENKPPVEPDQIPEEEFIGLLNNAINDPEISFNSIDEIRTAFEENRKFKQAESELQGLTQEERARIEMGRESGDFGLYDRVMSIDTAKITPKEALKQFYFLDNIGKNPQFLERAFEKEFAKTYEEEPDEDFSKMLLENNGQEAISKIIDLQEDLKKRGQISGSADPEEAKKAKMEEDNKWFAAVDNVINKNDRVTYTLEDGLAINIVMDAKDKALIQDAMDRPVDFLKSLVTDEKGNYDHDALYEVIMRLYYFEEALNEAKKSGAAFREEKILKEKKNAVIESAKAGDAGTETKISDQIAANLSRLINY